MFHVNDRILYDKKTDNVTVELCLNNRQAYNAQNICSFLSWILFYLLTVLSVTNLSRVNHLSL